MSASSPPDSIPAPPDAVGSLAAGPGAHSGRRQRDLGRRGRTERVALCATPRLFFALLVVLGAAVVVVAVAGVSAGAVSIAPGTVWRVVAAHLGLAGVDGSPDPATNQIVWTVRVPRVLLAMLVGAGMAVTGVVIQAVVRNALGDPYLIGIVPGAGLGATAVIVSGSAAVGGLSLSGAAFLGALLSFAVTLALGRHRGQWPPSRLVLAGVAVGYLAGAFTYFLQVRASPNDSQRVLFWTLGSVSGARWSDLGLPALVIALGTGWLLLYGPRLNALVSGPDVAASLGIAVARLQIALMALAAVVTGSIVAVAGGVVFVGLVVPHVARLLVGAEHRRVLVTSVLLGAAFLPLADLVARTVQAPVELPLGVVTAAVGAPFFIWLLRSSDRGRAR